MSQPMPSGGRLRTYLGIAPGVGKTYEMLRDARSNRRAGVDAVVAYQERHGRAATAAQLADLEVLPARTITYRGVSFNELDVTAVLDRGPELALVDELAHANLPGERHEKRWQDVAELLASGIDVYTTLNIANLESLGALVARITGVHPAEPVPTRLCATARSSSSTWRPRRFAVGWPRASSSPRSGSTRHCRTTSASWSSDRAAARAGRVC